MKRADQSQVTHRHFLIYGTAVVLTRLGTRFLSRTHEEISPQLHELRRQGYSFLYIGLHKSLWETTGVQGVLQRNHMKVPYAAMGDNLVRGRFYQAVAKRSGLFLVKRAAGRQGLLESAASLKDAVIKHINAKIDVIIYPEGTRKNIPQYGRYGSFFTAAFEAALELVQAGTKLALVPVNVDYSQIREDHEMLRRDSRHPRTLHVLDSLKMLSHLGDIYVNIGDPILPNEGSWNRKTLAALLHQRCLDLIKILPINVISWAIYSLRQKGIQSTESLYQEIENNIRALAPYEHRFRGFGLHSSGQELFGDLIRKRKEFARWTENDPGLQPFFKLYRDYIGHLAFPEPVQP